MRGRCSRVSRPYGLAVIAVLTCAVLAASPAWGEGPELAARAPIAGTEDGLEFRVLESKER